MRRSLGDRSHDSLHGGTAQPGLFRQPPKPVCMNGAADRLLFQFPTRRDLSFCAQNRRKCAYSPGSLQPDGFVPGTSYGGILSHTARGKNLPKESARSADKQIKSKMLPGLTTVRLPQIYCQLCHLSTRSDLVRCLHCNRPLKNAPAPIKRSVRKAKAIRRIN